MKSILIIWFSNLLIASLVNAEMDGRFLYVSKIEGATEYVFSDGPRGEADVKTKDMDKVVKAIGRLKATGSLNYVAMRKRGGVKMSDLLPIFTAIEKNLHWELVILEKEGGRLASIARHHLDANDPKKEQWSAQQDGTDQPATAPESKPKANSKPQPKSEGRPQ